MPARKPSDRRHGGDDDVAALNLVPIMAILVILIPMLIYMFNFSEIKVQRVMAPRRGTGSKTTKETKEKPLNLTVMIKGTNGFALTWEEALMPDMQRLPVIPMRQADSKYCGDPDKPEDNRRHGCWYRPEGCFCYDFPQLYNELVKLKNRFSKPEKPERRINLTANSDVPWEVVSRTMDAAHCMLEEQAYQDFESYMAAPPKLGVFTCTASKTKHQYDELPDDGECTKDGTAVVRLCKELFPQVVFAMAD